MSNQHNVSEYACHWDWFTFVFKLPSSDLICNSDIDDSNIHQALDLVLSKLKLDDANFYQGSPLSSYHYDASRVLSGENSILLGYNHKYVNGDSIMVQMSGSGYDFWMRYLESKGYDIFRIEKDLFNDDVLKLEPSRVDIALDLFNFEKEYSPMYVNKVTAMGNYIGRSKPTWVHSYGVEGTIKDDSKYSTSEEGTTLYFGSGGKKQLRIYNKKAERLAKKSQHYDCDSWYRWEFELRGQIALDFWNLYFENGQSLIDSWRFWLSSNYRWIEKIGPKQEKKSRYPNAKFYSVLIDGFEDAKPIKHEHLPMTYERTKSYIDRSKPSALKLIQHDIMKCQQNGMDYEQAKKVALLNYNNYLIEKLESGNVNYDDVMNYFLNENEAELAEQAEEMKREQLEHPNGF